MEQHGTKLPYIPGWNRKAPEPQMATTMCEFDWIWIMLRSSSVSLKTSTTSIAALKSPRPSAICNTTKFTTLMATRPWRHAENLIKIYETFVFMLKIIHQTHANIFFMWKPDPNQKPWQLIIRQMEQQLFAPSQNDIFLSKKITRRK